MICTAYFNEILNPVVAVTVQAIQQHRSPSGIELLTESQESCHEETED